MQEEESIVVVRCRMKISSLGITVRPNSFPRDGSFNLHRASIKNFDCGL